MVVVEAIGEAVVIHGRSEAVEGRLRFWNGPVLVGLLLWRGLEWILEGIHVNSCGIKSAISCDYVICVRSYEIYLPVPLLQRPFPRFWPLSTARLSPLELRSGPPTVQNSRMNSN